MKDATKDFAQHLFAQQPTVHQWWPWLTFEYVEDRERVFLHAPLATYADLLQSRTCASADLARARRRAHRNPCHRHTERLTRLNSILATFGPRMAQHPAMTLAEASLDMPSPFQASSGAHLGPTGGNVRRAAIRA